MNPQHFPWHLLKRNNYWPRSPLPWRSMIDFYGKLVDTVESMILYLDWYIYGISMVYICMVYIYGIVWYIYGIMVISLVN